MPNVLTFETFFAGVLGAKVILFIYLFIYLSIYLFMWFYFHYYVVSKRTKIDIRYIREANIWGSLIKNEGGGLIRLEGKIDNSKFTKLGDVHLASKFDTSYHKFITTILNNHSFC